MKEIFLYGLCAFTLKCESTLKCMSAIHSEPLQPYVSAPKCFKDTFVPTQELAELPQVPASAQEGQICNWHCPDWVGMHWPWQIGE